MSADLEAIVIIFHIGSSKKSNAGVAKDFFGQAKNCIAKILLRKIFSESKDLLSVIIAGSEKTENDLAEDGEYQNIEVLSPFILSNWALVEGVINTQPTEIFVNWLHAVVVGIQCLRDKVKEIEDYKKLKKDVKRKKLVLLSSFLDDVPDDQVDSIVEGLKDNGVELVVIGPDVLKIDLNDSSTAFDMEKCLTQSQQLILKIYSEVADKGTICSCDDALLQLRFFNTKVTKRAPWNVDMAIGPDIPIPITGFKMLSDNQQSLKWKLCSSNNEPVRRNRSYFLGENEVDHEDVISGYLFGSEIVPFSAIAALKPDEGSSHAERDTARGSHVKRLSRWSSKRRIKKRWKRKCRCAQYPDDDEKAIRYCSGERGLSVLFTVPSDEIPKHLFMGQSPYFIIGRKNQEVAQLAISAFASALAASNTVAVARKVYNRNSSVSIGALFPKVDKRPYALIYIELPFKNEIQKLWFPSLSNVSVTSEQLSAVDKLINDMDLSNTEDDEDPYQPENLYDPYEQYIFHSVAKRGLQSSSENDSLEVPQFIKDLLLPMPATAEKSKSALEEIKNLFPLEVVEREISVKTENGDNSIVKEEYNVKEEAEESENGNVADFFYSTVLIVGTVNPESDFLTLLAKGEQFEKVCEQMQKVIVELLRRADNLDMLKKPLLCMNMLRNSCIEKKQPDFYNEWMIKLKETIIDIRQQDFWDKIIKDNLGLITSEEDNSSNISVEMADEFSKYDTALIAASKDEPMDFEEMLGDI